MRVPARAVVVSVIVAAGGAGCLGSSEQRALDCGAGDAFVFAGVDYCVYAAAIIIEGFDCPEAVPFGFEAGGAMVCSPTEAPPDGGWDDIVEAWEDEKNPDPVGDVVGDGSDGGGEVSPGPRTACEVALAAPDGSTVVVVDVGTCPVERRCADGVVARCGNGLWACDCSFGDTRCFALTESVCPAHAADVGEACHPELGADACGVDRYCAEDRRCAELPAVCAGGCYDDADCAGACVGGSRVTGVAGRCVDAPASGSCWEDGDCPGGWTCSGPVVSCAPCAPCSTTHTAGTCLPAASEALGLVAGAELQPVALWYITAIYAAIECPSFVVEVRDESTGAWTTGAAETTCSAPVAPPSASVLARPGPTLDAGDFPWVWARARGNYYTGCVGASPDTCAEGPFELVSEPVLLLP